MKRFLIIGLLVITGNVFSQPVITAENHLPEFGDWYEVSMLMELADVSPGKGGENQFWDFSNLPQSTLSPKLLTFIDPTGTPHAEEVPECNLAIHDGASFYQYLKTSASGYEWSTVFVNENFALYTDPFTILQFPFTYNNQFTDSYNYTITQGEMTSNFYGTQLIQADGYGTLVSPVGTFENVLRVVRKSENNSVTSVGGFSWPYSDSTYEYQWYAPGITYPLVSLTTWPNSSIDTFDVIYISNYGLTTSAKNLHDKNNIIIYPNPATDKINLVSDEPWDSAALMDIAGKTILDWENNLPSPFKNSLSVKGIKPGIYFLQVYHKTGKSITRKIIIQ